MKKVILFSVLFLIMINNVVCIESESSIDVLEKTIDDLDPEDPSFSRNLE